MNSLNEETINEYLRVSLKTYLELKKKRQHELATAILGYSSQFADLALDSIGARKNNSPVYCPTCKKKFDLGSEIEFLNQVGYCYNCEDGYLTMLEMAREEYGEN